jgi:hypothetical protein
VSGAVTGGRRVLGAGAWSAEGEAERRCAAVGGQSSCFN